ncbi:MAG TPA: hypothetical protein VGJ21_25590 [Terracidiphilus sp.]
MGIRVRPGTPVHAARSSRKNRDELGTDSSLTQNHLLRGVVSRAESYFRNSDRAACLLLINRRDLMGEHRNSRLWNVIAWSTSIIGIGMTMVMLWCMLPGH